MREIKFKAMREDGRGWVYGDLIQTTPNGVDGTIICWIKPVTMLGLGFFTTPTERFIKVIQETVSQFTGLKDSENGEEIYEGDKIKTFLCQTIFTVVWHLNGFKLMDEYGDFREFPVNLWFSIVKEGG